MSDDAPFSLFFIREDLKKHYPEESGPQLAHVAALIFKKNLATVTPTSADRNYATVTYHEGVRTFAPKLAPPRPAPPTGNSEADKAARAQYRAQAVREASDRLPRVYPIDQRPPMGAPDDLAEARGVGEDRARRQDEVFGRLGGHIDTERNGRALTTYERAQRALKAQQTPISRDGDE